MEIYLVPVLCFACSLAATPIVGRIARGLNVVSRPDGVRRLHAHPTPLWGGVGVCFGLVVGIVLTTGVVREGAVGTPLPVALGLSACLLCFVGLVDDWTAMSARTKVLGQIGAVLPIVVAGLVVKRVSFLGWEVVLGGFGVVWTVGWLLLLINALNLLDGSDGLAATIGVLTSLSIAAIAIFQGRLEIALLALSLAGALGGFFLYNRPTARIYLGDGGSTVIGLSLALLAQQASMMHPATANLTVMGLLLFIPLLDTGLAIVRRALKGEAIFAGDRGHLHHQLQGRGFSAWSILMLVGGLCLVSSAAAWWAVFWGRGLWAWLALSAVTGVLMGARLVAQEEWGLLLAMVSQVAGGLRRSAVGPSPAWRLRIYDVPPEATAEGQAGRSTESAVGQRHAA